MGRRTSEDRLYPRVFATALVNSSCRSLTDVKNRVHLRLYHLTKAGKDIIPVVAGKIWDVMG